MKPLFAILICFALSACVTTSYYHDATTEQFKLTSVMKKVDGLKASRKGQEFVITADKTGGDTEAILQMFTMMQALLLKTMVPAPVPMP